MENLDAFQAGKDLPNISHGSIFRTSSFTNFGGGGSANFPCVIIMVPLLNQKETDQRTRETFRSFLEFSGSMSQSSFGLPVLYRIQSLLFLFFIAVPMVKSPLFYQHW